MESQKDRRMNGDTDRNAKREKRREREAETDRARGAGTQRQEQKDQCRTPTGRRAQGKTANIWEGGRDGESQSCGTQKIKVNRLPDRRKGAATGTEAGRPGHPGRWGWRCDGTAPAQAGLTPTAYKKMKELSVLSLLCSCFYSQPHPNTVYQYGGECARLLP